MCGGGTPPDGLAPSDERGQHLKGHTSFSSPVKESGHFIAEKGPILFELIKRLKVKVHYVAFKDILPGLTRSRGHPLESFNNGMFLDITQGRSAVLAVLEWGLCFFTHQFKR